MEGQRAVILGADLQHGGSTETFTSVPQGFFFGLVNKSEYYPFLFTKSPITDEPAFSVLPEYVVYVSKHETYIGVGIDWTELISDVETNKCEEFSGQLVRGRCYHINFEEIVALKNCIGSGAKIYYTAKDQPYYDYLTKVWTATKEIISRGPGARDILPLLSKQIVTQQKKVVATEKERSQSAFDWTKEVKEWIYHDTAEPINLQLYILGEKLKRYRLQGKPTDDIQADISALIKERDTLWSSVGPRVTGVAKNILLANNVLYIYELSQSELQRLLRETAATISE